MLDNNDFDKAMTKDNDLIYFLLLFPLSAD